jgi:hypothetical protein
MYKRISICLVCFCMPILLLLLHIHNLCCFLQKFILFSFNSSVTSNNFCVFLTSFSLLHYLFVCLFVTIIIIRHELGLYRSASACTNCLFKSLHKSSSSIWPIIQHYFWYSGVVHSCYVAANLIYICLVSH